MKVPQINDRRDGSEPPEGFGEGPVYDLARKRGWIAYGLHLAGGIGIFGVHRFYLGFYDSAKVQLALAFLWIVSLFSIGVPVSTLLQVGTTGWYLIDLFLIPGLVRRRNAQIAEAIAARA